VNLNHYSAPAQEQAQPTATTPRRGRPPKAKVVPADAVQ